MNVKLTVEDVRTAIFNGSSYASYDGAQYYANGINMQEIADELNTRAERTCRIEGRYGNQYCTCCGEMIGTWDSTSELYVSGNMVELWNYCPNCGAKVVDE